MEKLQRIDDRRLYRGDRVINFRPLLFLSLSFGLGIFLSFAAGMRAYWALFLLLPTGIAGLLLKIFRKKKVAGAMLFALAVLAFYCVGAFSFTVRISSFENDPVLEGEYTFKGRLIEIGDAGYRRIFTLSDLELISESGDAVHPQSRLVVYVYGAGELPSVGSIVQGSAAIETYDSIAYGRLNTSSLLSHIRYRATAEWEELSFTDSSAKAVFASVRNCFREVLFSSTDTGTASIAYALLVGDSGYMDEDVLQNFRYGGIAHIFAVSGLHIGVIYALFYKILRKCGVRRAVCLPIVFSALLFYSGVCGFSPSSVRALIMCTVMMLAEVFGENYDRLNSVSVASLIVLIVNPVYLFSVGFQLSVAAAAGIIVVGGCLGRLFARIRFLPQKFSSALAVALSAQLCTFPILIDCFGYVSAISLVLNLLFIPVISAVYALLFVCMIAASVFPAAGGVILYLPCLFLQVAVQPVMAADFGVLLISGFTFGAAAAIWYLLLFFLSDKINLKPVPKTAGSALLCTAFALCMFLQNTPVGYGAVLSLYADYGGEAAVLREADTVSIILFSSPDPAFFERVCLREGLDRVDELIVLDAPRELNTAIPVVLDSVGIGTVIVREGSEFVNSFRTVNIVEQGGFFTLAGSPARFFGDEALYMNWQGADLVFCGEEVSGPLPGCDLLIALNDSSAPEELCAPSCAVYFEKTPGKLNLYSAGDLQIGVKNGIIDIITEQGI